MWMLYQKILQTPGLDDSTENTRALILQETRSTDNIIKSYVFFIVYCPFTAKWRLSWVWLCIDLCSLRFNLTYFSTFIVNLYVLN